MTTNSFYVVIFYNINISSSLFQVWYADFFKTDYVKEYCLPETEKKLKQPKNVRKIFKLFKVKLRLLTFYVIN
jgi:hypothetical protein